MAKIKFTKNELKKQKDSLKRYKRYLPTLILKKQQLQMEIRKIQRERLEKSYKLEEFIQSLQQWISLFSENLNLFNLIIIEELKVDVSNIAGIDIPIFKTLVFKNIEYDVFNNPLWIDKGIYSLKKVISLKKELMIIQEQIRLLNNELRVTTQRVNLFEKVKIPESEYNIKKIRIYLGDVQTAAVVCGKISKNKLQRVS